MKKLLIIIILISYNHLFSQNYHFDYIYKVKLENKTYSRSLIYYHLISSENTSIDVEISEFSNDELIIHIADYKNLVIHNFFIRKDADFLDSKNFIYKYSGKIINRDEYKKIVSDKIYNIKPINDGIKKEIFEIFKKTRDKKPEYEILASLKESDTDLRVFTIGKIIGIDPFFINLESKENYYINHAEWNHNKEKIVYEVLEFNKINLEISTPKELVYSEIHK